MSKLLGSAASEKELEKLLQRFFYNNEVKIHGQGVYNAKGQISGIRVMYRRKRYRAEMILETITMKG